MSAIPRTAQEIVEATKRFNFGLLWARLLYWLFTIFSKIVMAIIYGCLISKGLRLSHPETGMKLYKLLPALEDYELTYQWDLAHLTACILLVMSWFLWHLILRFLVSDQLEKMLHEWGWGDSWPKRLIFTIGGIIITVDACVFYRCFNAAIWGQSSFNPGALIATLGYVTILVGVTFVSIFLGQNVTFLKNKAEKECVPTPSSRISSSEQSSPSSAQAAKNVTKLAPHSDRSPATTSS